MRNLLGRLNARSAEELSRISVAWQVPVSGSDKLGQVAQLYRALTDPTSARDLWSRLPPDERALITLLLSADESARPLAELAAQLGQPEADVRQIAARLYFKGIVVRIGDDDPLPVGEAPRLFLPREVGILFKRVTDEIAAGDVSHTPIAVLLQSRDDRQIEEAAEHWGVRVIPGLRTREEIMRQLLTNIGDPRRLPAVESRLRREASRIWPLVRDAVDGKPVTLAEVIASEGVVTEDPRQSQRFRDALAELEEKLLVWHTYKPDGSRWLFVPAEIRSPQIHTPAISSVDLPAVVPFDAEVEPHHPNAVAWDLLTLLRALSPPQDHRIFDFNDAPKAWLRKLNDNLWNRGVETPLPSYLEFLSDLARVEGVLTGGDPAVEEPFQVSPAVRTWRDRTFADQTARLRATWLGSSSWIEGSDRDDIEIEGADWPGFRLKLLAHLALVQRNTAYTLEEVSTWLSRHDPDLLGASFDVSSARNPQFPNDDAANRRAAIAEVAGQVIESAFCWFGMADVILRGREPRLVRFRLEQPEVNPPTSESGAALTVSPAGDIALNAPSPLRVWSLTAFADAKSLRPESAFRVTERSISRALQAGFEIRHVESFLTKQSGQPLPPEFLERLHAWSQSVRRIRVARTLRLTADDLEQAEQLGALLEKMKQPNVRVGEEFFVTMENAAEISAGEVELFARLTEAGFSPQGLESQRRANQQRPNVVAPPQKRR